MQIDMHFYGTYALARMAGFPPDLAKTIATSAQFVDEATSAIPIKLGEERYQLPVISAHDMLDTKNFNQMDQWNVWMPFHFLPGGQGERIDQRLVCLWGEPGNFAVDEIITLVLEAGAAKKPYALHLLGIATHVIQDTYAHYGFSGMASDYNEVNQTSLKYFDVNKLGGYIDKKRTSFWDSVLASFAEATKLGHAGAATYPDRPYLKWDFHYEHTSGLDVEYLHRAHDNPATFLMACTRLHALYDAYLKNETSITTPQGHLPFADPATDTLNSIIRAEGEGKERCRFWRDAINKSMLFESASEEHNIQYNPTDWTVGFMKRASMPALTDAFNFNRAASIYINKVHDDILPQLKIL